MIAHVGHGHMGTAKIILGLNENGTSKFYTYPT